jgi:hypothetical protein
MDPAAIALIDSFVGQINAQIKRPDLSSAYNYRVADIDAAYRAPNVTGPEPLLGLANSIGITYIGIGDVHPNDHGHAVIAGLLAGAYGK